jgi:hypothetical protein
MNEQWKIGVVLSLKGDANTKLKEFYAAIQRTNKAVDTLRQRLIPVKESIARIAVDLSKVNPHMRAFSEDTLNSARSMGGLASTLRKGNAEFTVMDRKLTSTAAKMDALAKHAETLKSSMQDVGGGGGGMGAGRTGGRGKGHRRSGVHVRSSHIGMLGFNGPMIAAGLATMGLYHGFEAESDYQRAFMQYKQQGYVTDADNALADKIASNVKLPGISPIAMMDALTDATMATTDVAKGRMLAPHLANIAMANKINYGDFTRKQEKDLVKFAELRGGSDSQKVLAALDLGQKMYSLSGGRIQPSELKGFISMAGTAGYHLTDQALFELESSIQEKGGQKIGTALQTGFNQMISFKGMSKKSMADLTNLGIMKHGKLADVDLFQTNIVEWFRKDYLSALKAHGVTKDPEIIRRIGFDFNRTFAAAASVWLKDSGKIDRAIVQSPKAKGEIGSVQDAFMTPGGTIQLLSTSYNKFNKALGNFIMPSAQAGMKDLATMLDHLTAIIGRLNVFFGIVDSYNQKLEKITSKFFPSINEEGNILKDKKQPAKESAVVQLHVDGKPLMQTLLPHLTQSIYLTQIQQKSGFMPGMTPTPVSSLPPF